MEEDNESEEVIHVRPYEAPHGEVRKRWTKVTEHLQRLHGVGITVNATRKRFDDLMTAFHADSMAALRVSGTDEEYEERAQLLQDIHDLTDKEEKAKQNERHETNGEKIRDAAMSTMKRKSFEVVEVDGCEDAPPNKRQSRGSSHRVAEAGVVVASLVEMVAKANEIKAEEVRTRQNGA
ncbi:hypothetical protein H257_15235 [Aphanomyces astaci]|uniref:Uncharacterized protein n=1 Tax=Aphanomyces astaci TaxID=112090 RepID=W4FMZ4_APHAT|nr:hypothetical protein H257_15235 [Aphanomyces astaci]ETV68882.1 hypothetical protein H257_15235 [Aphanomyces astaci]|eukprot:XP_009841559.1 hypothetical protein H257_15235 [Aphanomyces astaci]